MKQKKSTTININWKINIIEFLVVFISIFSLKLIIFVNFEQFFYVDCYSYINQAKNLLQAFQNFSFFSRGAPFIIYLYISLKIGLIFSPNVLVIVKIAMFILNLVFYLVFYITLKKFKSKKFAFISLIFLLFEPAFNEFSLMPYLETFTFLFSCISIYCVFEFLEKKKNSYLLLGISALIVSILTRYEIIIIILIPLIVIVIISNSSQFWKNKKLIALFFSFGALIIFMIPIFYNYYFSITRFNPLYRVILSLNFSLFKNTINYITNITDLTILNVIFGLLCFIGTIYLLIDIIGKNIKLKKEKNNLKDKTAMMKELSFLLIALFNLIVTHIFYGYSYTFNENELIIFPLKIGNRFLMMSRLFLIPICIYPFFHLPYNDIFDKIYQKLLYLFTFKQNLVNLLNFYNIKLILKKIFILNLIIFSFFIYIPFLSLRSKEVIEVGDSSMALFRETANWLDENQKSDEISFIPFDFIYYTFNPTLFNITLSYNYIWEQVNINPLKADLTNDEILTARSFLISLIKERKEIKYLVVDWMDKSAGLLVSTKIDNELSTMIVPAFEENYTLDDGYTMRIIIYSINR